MSKKDVFINGIWKENPVLVSLLGLCSVLGVSNSVSSAIGMGLGFTFVLILSNIIIAAIRKIVPDEIRIPIYIVVVATLVTVVQMVMNAYLPDLYTSLGGWLSLIVVNCIILGRAEAFANKNTVLDSLLDGVGMSIGYSLVIVILAIIREFFGTGGLTIWGDIKFDISDGAFFTEFFTKAPSAFILLGFFIGFANLFNNRKKKGASK